MIKRNIEDVLEDKIKHYPITLLTGPRAIGKYTLLYNAFINKGYFYVSLDDSLELSAAITIIPKVKMKTCTIEFNLLDYKENALYSDTISKSNLMKVVIYIYV